MKTLSTLLAGCLCALCLAPTLVEAQTITTRVLDFGTDGPAGTWSSMTMVNGKPAVAYYSPIEKNLMFARNSAADGSGTWMVITVEHYGDVGYDPQLLSVNGNPAISYYDNTSGVLKYIRATDANGTVWGQPVAIDATTFSGGEQSLAIINGRPAIAYAAFIIEPSVTTHLRYVRANDANGTTWSTPVEVDNPGVNQTGGEPSLLEVNGRPAIAYQFITHGDLKYVRANDSDGAAWGAPLTLEAEATGLTGFGNSLAIVNGMPAISYRDDTQKQVRFIRANDANGTSWAPSVTVHADGTGATNTQTTLITANGQPAIGYLNRTNLTATYVRASDVNGATWGTPISVGSTGVLDAYNTSFAIVAGNPAMTFYDAINKDLKFVRSGNVDGSVWPAPGTVDAGVFSGVVGEYSSQVVINGNPAVAYYDQTHGDLKYTRANDAAGTSWAPPVTVDSAGNTGRFARLAEVDGRPAICYQDVTNRLLKYARATDAIGAAWGTPVTLSIFYDGHHSIAIVNGNPAISYAWLDDLYYIRANDAVGSSWGSPVLLDSGQLHAGEYCSLAIVNGQPAVSYHADYDYGLMFVRANDVNGAAWGTPVIVQSGTDTGQHTSLAIVNGHPAISFFDETSANGDLAYVRANDVNGATWGSRVIIDTAGGNLAGEYSSMVVFNGKPVISYYNELTGLMCAVADDPNGATWASPVLVDGNFNAASQFLGNAGKFSSLAAVNGRLAVSYFDGFNPVFTTDFIPGDLKWATIALAAPDISVAQGGPLIDGVNSVAFPRVGVGSSTAPLTFTITNSGNLDLSGLAITKDGANSGDFTVDTGAMLTALAPGNSTTFSVTFSPTASGSRSAALHIASNVTGSKNPFDITLTGSDAPSPEIAVEQPSGADLTDGGSTIDFGTAVPGVSVVRTFTIRNRGDATLNVSTPTKDGSDAVDFAIGTLSGSAIAAGGTATFEVTFNTSTEGAKTAAIHIASDDANENPFDITLTATGAAPEIAVEQPAGTGLTDNVSSIDYGNVVLGASSVKTFTIKNTGTEILTLSGATKDGTDAADFVLGALSSTSVVPGGSATINVTFTPASLGSKTAAIHIESNDADETLFDIALAGTGVLQEIVVEQPAGSGLTDGVSTIAYGTTLVGSPVVKTFTVRNTGTATLTLSAVTKDGADASHFTVGALSATNLAPSATATFDVTFNPSSIGAKTAAIHIPSNDTDENPFDIALTGTGTAPEIGVEQPAGNDLADGSSTVAYGNVLMGTPSTKTFTVRNLGDQDLTGLAVTKDGANASEFTVAALSSTTIAPGSSATFDVTFTTFAIGARTAAIHIASNDASENPFDISLSATGFGPEITVEQPAGTGLTDSTSTVSFGSTPPGTPVVRTFTVKNTGTTDLTGLGLTIDGVDAAAFTSGALGATSLAAGTSTTFDVTFNPSTTGAKSAAVHIASNDANENPFDINLSGTGVTPEIVVEQPAGTSLTDGTSTVAYGSVGIGSSTVKTFTIKNTGTNTLTISGITKDGAHAAEITIGTLSSSTIAPAGSATFDVTFSPASLGAKTAAIHIASDDADESPFDINLTAAAVFQAVYRQGSPDPFTGATYAGHEDVWLFTNGVGTFTDTRNSGADPRAIVGGINTSAPRHELMRFNIASLATQFAAINKVTLRLYWQSNSAATTTVADTVRVYRVAAANSGWVEGNGFSNVDSQAGWSTWSHRIYNTTSWASSPGASNPGVDYINTIIASKAYNLAELAGDVFDIEFTDTTFINDWLAGNNTGLFLRNINETGSVIFHASEATTVSLRPALIIEYTPSAPEVALEQPAGTNLPDGTGVVSLGTTSPGIAVVKTVTVRNTGTGNLTLSAFTKDGPDAADFSVGAFGTATVAPGATTTFDVTFNPSTTGAKSASLHLPNNDTDENPFDIDLSGTSVPPFAEIGVEQPAGTSLTDGSSTVGYGTVLVGSSVARTFTIRNTGNLALALNDVIKDGPNAAVFTVGSFSSSSVAPGSSATLDVVFTPTTSGTASAVIHIVSNDGDESPFDIALEGTGTTAVPDIVVEQPAGTNLTDAASTIAFGGAAPGTPVVKTFTIKNNGNFDLTGIALTKDGADAASFTLGTPGSTTVVPGGSTTFDVTFNAAATGFKVAVIRISSNDGDESPFDIVVVASGSLTATYKQGANDPFTGTAYAGNEDLWLFNNGGAATDQNTGADARVIVGGVGGTSYRHELMRFNITTLAGQFGSIDSATLRLYWNGANSSTGTYQVFPLATANAGWVEGNSGSGGTAPNGVSTWGHRVRTTQNWASTQGASTAGTDYVNTVIASKAYGSAATNTTFDLVFTDTSVINNWAGGSTAGLFMRTALRDNQAIFHSSESTAAYRPELIIGYSPPAAEIVVEQPITSALADGIGAVAFADTLMGTSTARVFTIRNIGTANLTGLTITKDGSDAGDFTITTNPTAPLAGPAGSTTFTVEFNPTAPGARAAAIHVASNDADENAFDIALTGTGTAPEVAVHNGSNTVAPQLSDGQAQVVGFGLTAQGVPVARHVTLSNTGTGALSVSSITVPAGFTVLNAPGAPIPAAATHTFQIQLDAGSVGTFGGNVIINSTDIDEAAFDFPISGTVQNAPFHNWAAASGLSGTDLAPLANPSGDGIVNLLKYAFNMDPAIVDIAVLTSATGTTGLPAYDTSGSGAASFFRIEFIRRIGSGLIYTPKKSTSLGTWNNLTSTPTVTTIDANWERVVYEEPFDGTATHQMFGMVEVTLP